MFLSEIENGQVVQLQQSCSAQGIADGGGWQKQSVDGARVSILSRHE